MLHRSGARSFTPTPSGPEHPARAAPAPRGRLATPTAGATGRAQLSAAPTGAEPGAVKDPAPQRCAILHATARRARAPRPKPAPASTATPNPGGWVHIRADDDGSPSVTIIAP